MQSLSTTSPCCGPELSNSGIAGPVLRDCHWAVSQHCTGVRRCLFPDHNQHTLDGQAASSTAPSTSNVEESLLLIQARTRGRASFAPFYFFGF
ncbi:hypothetical protein GN956_G23268 [Arapaima gigas]